MKKLIRLLIPVLVIGLVFAQGPVLKAQSPVKIVMWSIANETDPLHTATDAVVKAFNAANQGKVEVDITYILNDPYKTQLSVAVAGGQTPDIFMTWGGGLLQSYVASGVVREITALSGDAGKKFIAGALAPATFNGKHYAVPVDLAGVFLWTNTDILKTNNLPLPDTWANLISDCKALADKGMIPIALNNKDKWPGAFWNYYLNDRLGGSQLFSNAFNRTNGGTFTDPAFVQANKMIQDAVDAKCFEPGYNGIAYVDQALMGTGQAAMQLQGDWNLDGMKKAGLAESSLAALPFPKVDGGKGDPADMVGGTGQAYAISAKAPKEADDALIALMSDDAFGQGVAAAGLMPALVGYDKYVKDPIVQSEAATLAKAPFIQLYYDQFLPPDLAQVLLQTSQDTFGKATTPDKAAADMEAAVAKAAVATPAATASK